VKALLENGVQPDILVLRTEKTLTKEIRKKVALFCNVDLESVIESIDVSTIYEVPLLMQNEKLDLTALRKLNLEKGSTPELTPWKSFVDRLKNPQSKVKIALVGKYVELHDSYKSIIESLTHAGAVNRCEIDLTCIHSETINTGNLSEKMKEYEGIIVAPGFGDRGIEGKILAVHYARENYIPYLGICLGMQCAVIEFARNVLNYPDAHSTEMTRMTEHPVIDLMEDQKGVTEKGGTMRLGAYPCDISKGTRVYDIYQEEHIRERHRHRYEFNNDYLDDFENAGFRASGINPDSQLVEIMELEDHPWFIGVQFHPEYRSNVLNPHPLFVHFVKAALQHSGSTKKKAVAQKQ
jgi:CTP synthase